MPGRIDERTQFVDENGEPIVNGNIYIGLQNLDPVANPKTIYSDKALTTPLANPQLTDSNGRSVNKIYLVGDYSIRVDDSLGVQKLLDLDSGQPENISQTALSNVTGADTITADTNPAITAYTDNALYIFKAVGPNTAAVTLNIESLGAKAIVKNFNLPLDGSDFVTNQTVVVAYNATTDNFQWVNQKIDVEVLNPVGQINPYIGTTAPAGWILLDGGTIGNAASGGTTRANADTEDLFTLFWDSMADAQAPVSGGRGASAAADFAANKNITISNLMNGAVPVGTGGTAPAIHGNSGGAETHTLVESELAAHTHTHARLLEAATGGPNVHYTVTSGSAGTTGSTGGDGAHNNMPPWVAVSYICKL